MRVEKVEEGRSRMLKNLSTIMLKLAVGWTGDEICEANVKFLKGEKSTPLQEIKKAWH